MDFNATGLQVTDEFFTGDIINVGKRLSHDLFRADSVSIRTASEGGGTLLALGTDYVLSVQDMRRSAAASTPVYTQITIINAAYVGDELFVTYKAVGDYISSESVQRFAREAPNDSALEVDMTTDFVQTVEQRRYRVFVLSGALSSQKTFTLQYGDGLKEYVFLVNCTGNGSVLVKAADAGAQVTLSFSADAYVASVVVDEEGNVVNTVGQTEDSGAATNVGYTLSEGQFETGFSKDWSTYADAASDTPVDGTGGSPNVTFQVTDVEPLVGQRSAVFAKSGAASRQGEGVSALLTIDTGLTTQPCRITLRYKTSANYVGGDVRVFAYDIDGGVLLATNNRDLPAAFGTPSVFMFDFFPTIGHTHYRFMLHVATTSALDYEIKIDDVQVGSNGGVVAVRRTPWIPYPAGSYSMPNGTPVVITSGKVPIGAVAANPTKGTTSEDSAMYSEEGEDCLINVNYKQISAGSNAGNGIYLFALPLGKTIDLTKNPVGSICLNGLFSDGLSSVNATVVVYSSTTLALQYVASDPAYYLSSVRYPTTGANAQYRFTARVACAQQSINCVFNGINEPFYLSNTESTVNTNGVVAKTKIGIDGSPILANTAATYYDMTLPRALLPNERIEIEVRSKIDKSWIPIQSASVYSVGINILGAFQEKTSTNAGGIYCGLSLSKTSTGAIRLIQAYSSGKYGNGLWGDSSSDSIGTWAQVINASDGFDAWRVRIGQAGMSEVRPSVLVSVYQPTDQNLTANVTDVKFNTKLLDTHNAFNVTAGAFTPPHSGYYEISVSGWGIGTNTIFSSLYIYVNGVKDKWLARAYFNSGLSYGSGLTIMWLNAGVPITIRADASHLASGMFALNIKSI